jgi:hypothetical protein
VAVRDRALQGEGEEATSEVESAEEAEPTEADAASGTTPEEPEESASSAEGGTDEDPTAAGYDEAVEKGVPYHAEPEILAQESADPVALTEVEPYTEDELVLQEAGRDLRPDTIVPAPYITSAEAAAIESLDEFTAEQAAEAAEAEESNDEVAGDETNATEATQTSAPAVLDDAASSESTDKEKQDASPDAAQ